MRIKANFDLGVLDRGGTHLYPQWIPQVAWLSGSYPWTDPGLILFVPPLWLLNSTQILESHLLLFLLSKDYGWNHAVLQCLYFLRRKIFILLLPLFTFLFFAIHINQSFEPQLFSSFEIQLRQHRCVVCQIYLPFTLCPMITWKAIQCQTGVLDFQATRKMEYINCDLAQISLLAHQT